MFFTESCSESEPKGGNKIRQNDQLRKCWLSPGRSGGLMHWHWWRSVTLAPGDLCWCWLVSLSLTACCQPELWIQSGHSSQLTVSRLCLPSLSRAAWLGPAAAAGLASQAAQAGHTGFTLNTDISPGQAPARVRRAEKYTGYTSQDSTMCKHAQTLFWSTKQMTCLNWQ